MSLSSNPVSVCTFLFFSCKRWQYGFRHFFYANCSHLPPPVVQGWLLFAAIVARFWNMFRDSSTPFSELCAMTVFRKLKRPGLHVRRKHKPKHKPHVNRDDASTSARSFFLRLRRPGSHVAYACAYACVVRVNQPFKGWFIRSNSCGRDDVSKSHATVVKPKLCRVNRPLHRKKSVALKVAMRNRGVFCRNVWQWPLQIASQRCRRRSETRLYGIVWYTASSQADPQFLARRGRIMYLPTPRL